MQLPDPPVGSFASDNSAGVAPEVLAAIAEANTPAALAYGNDRWTSALTRRFAELFDRPVAVFPCWGGTGANVVGLATIMQPWQAVICAETAHIAVDECGAPGRFTGSAVLASPSEDGKLTADSISPWLKWLGSEHHSQPAVVSVSQVTELGTRYTVDELAALCDVAHRHDLLVHLDGARIANAVCDAGVSISSMVADTGVDVMTFGATKNGAMYGEVVVFLRMELATRAAFHRKQAGQLPSKARFIAAQVLVLLEDDLWLRHASHANAMARRLADRVRGIDGVRISREPEANSLFVHLPSDAIVPLQEWSRFWEWDLDADLVRWMTSFVTTEDDVERFAVGVETLLGSR